jgi:hypothetical protein
MNNMRPNKGAKNKIKEMMSNMRHKQCCCLTSFLFFPSGASFACLNGGKARHMEFRIQLRGFLASCGTFVACASLNDYFNFSSPYSDCALLLELSSLSSHSRPHYLRQSFRPKVNRGVCSC